MSAGIGPAGLPSIPPATTLGPVTAPIFVPLPDEAATQELGQRIADELEPGDVVALTGAVGAGKTTLSRAILRAHVGDPELEAPSPTFTLIQTYDGPKAQVVHADLYRIGGEGELVELGFDELQERAIMLVEWPERAPTVIKPLRLDVSLHLDSYTGERHAIIAGSGPLLNRIERASAIHALLDASGWAAARRVKMQGDASTRAYERLVKPTGETAILMISPPRPDGPPVRRGKPYSAIARLAENVQAFAAIDRGLRDQGFSAPAILAEDLETGLLVLEDFGTEPVASELGPIPERYGEAIRLLAALHAKKLPEVLAGNTERQYAIPPYDLDALMIEVELLLDWYLPEVAGTEPSGSVRAEFGHLWRATLEPIVAARPTWTLRDFHSPNLIWLPRRMGFSRIGLLDFQDAVLGHPAYDVASLLQDARVTVPAELELKLLGLYATSRRALDPDFDMNAFAGAYAVLGAQRATKILGIFARLNRRDGKPAYLHHLPRMKAYLSRNLAHPALSRLTGWYGAQLPDPTLDQSEGAA
jgi:N-acetylmuramate 1-kinase